MNVRDQACCCCRELEWKHGVQKVYGDDRKARDPGILSSMMRCVWGRIRHVVVDAALCSCRVGNQVKA